MNIEISKKRMELENQYHKKVLTLDEVSDYLGLGKDTIKELVKGGALKAINAGNEYLFKISQLINFEFDIQENEHMEKNPPSRFEKEEKGMKVTKGSIYNVGSQKNPLEMAFFITFPDGNKKRVKVRGKSEDEIQWKKIQKVEEETQKYYRDITGIPEYVEEERAIMTFSEVADKWYKEFLVEQESKGGSFANIDSVKHSINTIIKEIGTLDIIDIDTKTAQDMILKISKKEDNQWRSRSHVEKALRTFKSVMNYAFDNKYTQNRIGKLNLNKNLGEPKKDDRFLTDEEVRELLKCVQVNPFYSTLINLILSSGLRQEEALALNIDDIKRVNGKCMVHVSKALVEEENNKYKVIDRLKQNEEPRDVFIADSVYDMVIDYYNNIKKDERLMKKRIQNGTQDMIFTNQEGCVHNKRTLYHSFTNFLKRNNGPQIGLHMLRHTFASNMCDKISIDEVSEILGHKDISITLKFYKSFTAEQKKRASAGVNQMMEKLKGEEDI